MRRPITRAAAAVFAALTLAVAGCGTDTDTGTDTDDPALVLAASAEALGDEPFRLEMTMGGLMTATGAIDPAAGAGEMSIAFSEEAMNMEMQIIFTETDMWMNMGEVGVMIGADTPWMHLDLTRLGPDGFMGIEPGNTDPSGAREMLQALGEVTQTGDRTFSGEIDLTRAGSTVWDEETVELLGESATSVSFTATIDERDRLSTMVITLPEVPGAAGVFDSLELRVFDYGADVEITPPPADEVSPMPEALYEMFEM